MSYVSVVPELVTAAAADLETIGSTLDAARITAVPATLAVAPAAADEVSLAIAQLFSEHAQDYQAVARDAAAYQNQFVQNLRAAPAAYTAAEELIASLVRGLDAEVRYYATAGIALSDMIMLTPVQLLAFIAFSLFWPLLPLLPLLKFSQIWTLFTEVISRQPISYPYVESSLALAIIRAIIPGFSPTA
ncbi:PE family protein [Mycobacterium riyadhense]|uniref:PE family protein n=1 Tax=Mycobacterium riyadhense TaxID=486698 RepID=UPI000A14CB20|nr:PE family protein [Mycobacterium riyadhense]MCV7146912.1 PE family protein [Mycobacterium riyadhense]